MLLFWPWLIIVAHLSKKKLILVGKNHWKKIKKNDCPTQLEHFFLFIYFSLREQTYQKKNFSVIQNVMYNWFLFWIFFVDISVGRVISRSIHFFLSHSTSIHFSSYKKYVPKYFAQQINNRQYAHDMTFQCQFFFYSHNFTLCPNTVLRV